MATKKTIQEYKDEFSGWLRDLENYQTRFKDNYKRYTGYNETQGTETKISDPVAFELTERVIQKLYEKEPKFYADSRGKNLPTEVKNIITSTAEFMWNNPDRVQFSGPMRSKLKVGAREFIVTGNLAVESFWSHQVDAPDARIIPIEDVVFDPTKTLKTSPVYYIRQFVSLDYLKDNVEIKKDGSVVTGMFDSAAIKKLSRTVDERSKNKYDSRSNTISRSGTDLAHREDEFQLISRWEGKECVRFVMDDDMEKPVVVQEFSSLLDDDPLDFAMDVEVVKEPYAMSLIDPQLGLFKAKDLILNQTISYGAKVLNPPTIVNPNLGPVNLKTIANMYKLGGIVLGDPNQIKQLDVAGDPQRRGIEMMNWIEGRGEAITGINAYLAGVPSSQTDKTQGTKGGIEALVEQSASPVKDRQINLEESIIEPMINKWIKMVGATMSTNEIKWILVTGESPKWVKVTKGLLTGKIKLIDLMTAGLIENQEIQAIVDLMMTEGKDPEKDLLFDVDWLVRVETGSLAERDTQKEVENKKMVLELGIGLGLPIDAEKIWKEIASDGGFKEPENYIKKDTQMGMEGGINEQPGQPGEGQPVGAGIQNPVGVGNQPNIPQMAG